MKQGDIVYLGTPSEETCFDGAFRILDLEQTNTGEPGMFLLCENLIGRNGQEGFVFRGDAHPKTNRYAGSDAKKWCAEFFEKSFSPEEQEAILPTHKSDAAYVKLHEWELLGGKTRMGQCPFDPEEGSLDGDRVFLLSAEEGANPKYGLASETDRLAGFAGKAAAWWLRSPHAPDFPNDVGIVFFNGWLLDFLENKDSVFGMAPICMRPALNLDLSKVVDAEQVGEGEWVLRFAGESEEGYATRKGQYRYGARQRIEAKQSSGGVGDFFAKLGLSLFIPLVDLMRAIKDRKN